MPKKTIEDEDVGIETTLEQQQQQLGTATTTTSLMKRL